MEKAVQHDKGGRNRTLKGVIERNLPVVKEGVVGRG